ncbi:Uncharacterized conserved protein, DUF2147 family [Phyllobacterium sp. CL33Tsu]|nr:Uncharacterized conserved protein, DUF2147 family [Phyllobacterium sp. CL33Tsu]
MLNARQALCALLMAGALTTAAMAEAQEIAGTYVNETGRTKVKISDCNSGVCGTIVWMNQPVNDINNPDASKRDRPVVGLQAVSMKATGPGTYAGTLYDPETGKTYSGKAKVAGNAVELSGCVLGGLICKSATWRRD